MPKEVALETMRHSCSHLLAAAIRELYPEAKFAIGPAIETGFYYDVDFSEPISENDLPQIEKEMEKIRKHNLPFEREEVSAEEAGELFKDNPYKLELINEVTRLGDYDPPAHLVGAPASASAPIRRDGKRAGEAGTTKEEKRASSSGDLEITQSRNLVVSTYKTGGFVDLCRGPHVKNTKEIGPFKLLSITGAYWRGDEKNKMLTRIYGTCFATQKELDEYLTQLEEAEKRDHRKIGPELDLFTFHPEAPGDAFWHPKGYTAMKEMFRYWREVHEREGYVEVRTPELLTRETWDRSGHTSFFIDKMYKVTAGEVDNWNMAVKPMNCDGGMLIYKTKIRSYKELPLRMGELGVVHRYESSGETHGLMRVREFTQDDAHIYCTPDQVKDELKKVMDLCFEVYETFGLELDHLELSTRPENSIGSDEVWERAEEIMREVLKEKDLPHKINEGDGAFYGPKFDFHLRDAIGRTWQCATIQLDFAQPENFDLEYVTEKGTKERPVMIHRVLYGSVERFLGILIEHYAGEFPVWLAPVQAVVIPVSEKQNDYARNVVARLVLASEEAAARAATTIRAEADLSNESVGKKIRNAQLQKIPYMLIVGEKESQQSKQNTDELLVSLRLRTGEDLGMISLMELNERIGKKILTRSLEL